MRVPRLVRNSVPISLKLESVVVLQCPPNPRKELTPSHSISMPAPIRKMDCARFVLSRPKSFSVFLLGKLKGDGSKNAGLSRSNHSDIRKGDSILINDFGSGNTIFDLIHKDRYCKNNLFSIYNCS